MKHDKEFYIDKFRELGIEVRFNPGRQISSRQTGMEAIQDFIGEMYDEVYLQAHLDGADSILDQLPDAKDPDHYCLCTVRFPDHKCGCEGCGGGIMCAKKCSRCRDIARKKEDKETEEDCPCHCHHTAKDFSDPNYLNQPNWAECPFYCAKACSHCNKPIETQDMKQTIF